jgi:alkylated DNA repair dioxygenase AlkB
MAEHRQKMTYALDQNPLNIYPDAWLEHTPKAIASDSELFEELWKLWDVIPYTPNPMNKKTNINRKQATFGASYSFGAQKSFKVDIPEAQWPNIVSKVLEDVKRLSGSEKYKIVHVNWYPDGAAGLAPHSDNDSQMVPGMSIYSYTFLSEPGNPRGFQVYDKTNSKQLHDLQLDDGDLVVMSGEMQRGFTHGVKKSAAKRFKNLKRINLTVRAWS